MCLDRAIYRLRVWKVVIGVVGSEQGLMCGFVAVGRRVLLGGRSYERAGRGSRRQLGVQFVGGRNVV